MASCNWHIIHVLFGIKFENGEQTFLGQETKILPSLRPTSRFPFRESADLDPNLGDLAPNICKFGGLQCEVMGSRFGRSASGSPVKFGGRQFEVMGSRFGRSGSPLGSQICAGTPYGNPPLYTPSSPLPFTYLWPPRWRPSTLLGQGPQYPIYIHCAKAPHSGWPSSYAHATRAPPPFPT